MKQVDGAGTRLDPTRADPTITTAITFPITISIATVLHKTGFFLIKSFSDRKESNFMPVSKARRHGREVAKARILIIKLCRSQGGCYVRASFREWVNG